MSSLLHQAVELAQAGQREQARQLLWQYLQTHPDSDVAWLWLAAVAADQPEYVRALNEVRRIDPANARAQGLLDDFQRQYGPVASGSTPPYIAAGTPPPVGEHPSPPPPPPPATPAYQPPQEFQSLPVNAQDYDYGPPPKAKKREPVREPVRETRARGCGCLGCGVPGCGCLGCGGCWQGCFVALVLLILVPTVIFGTMSYGKFSLGPLDWFMTFLPDEFGTKTIKFETGDYRVEMEAPRSWFLVSEQNEMWLLARDVLSETVRFADSTDSWERFEDETGPVILETSLIALHMNGDVIALRLVQEQEISTTCDAVQAQADAYDGVHVYANGLCGYHTIASSRYTVNNIFTDATPPTEQLTYTIVVPVDESTALQWELLIADDMEKFYRDRITRLIETITVTRR